MDREPECCHSGTRSPKLYEIQNPKKSDRRARAQHERLGVSIAGGLLVVVVAQFLTLWNSLLQVNIVDNVDRFEWKRSAGKF